MNHFNVHFRHRERRATLYIALQMAMDNLANRLALGSAPGLVKDPLLFPYRTQPPEQKRRRREARRNAAREGTLLDSCSLNVAFEDADLRPRKAMPRSQSS